MDASNSGLFDALGTGVLVGYLGYIGGYVGGWLWMMLDPTRDIDHPIRIGEHGAAIVGLIVLATIGILSLR